MESPFTVATMSVSISRLQCEHYENPLGIGEPRPRLSWRFSGDAKDWAQTSYEVNIKHGASGTESHTVESSDNVLVPWPGNALKSQDRVEVQVRASGTDGKTTDWASLTIEAGLLSKEDWVAKPVTCERQHPDQPRRPYRARTTFTLPAQAEKARLYITALGVYEPYLNNQRLGEEILAPGWTAYDEHLVYRTFDVTDKLVKGQNVLGAWVGEGWYTGRVGFIKDKRNNYGERPALIAQLVVDGKAVASTGDGWEWSYGGLVVSELLDGEVYDTNNADHDWTQGDWRQVDTLSSPSAQLVASQSPPVRVVETFKPVEIISTPSGKTILDFGQNFAGVVRINNEPTKGAKELVIRHAEVLEHGELGTRPLRRCKATDRIILGGKQSLKGYQPKFTSHGFRYAEVTGWPGITADDITGVAFHSAMERTGFFECSHKLINRLHENVVWSTIGNTVSIPTDCPQRDERLGWTGDIQAFAPTLNYLFDSSGFLQSWFKDLYVEQQKFDGNVPVTIPDILGDFKRLNQRLAVWGDVAVLTPFDTYMAYGDKGILEQQYDSAVMWLEKGVVRDKETGMWDPKQPQLSDWLAPKAPPENAGDAPTDSILVANLFLYHTTNTMSRFADALGRAEQATHYKRQAEGLAKGFIDEYVTHNGRVMSDTQTALALMVAFGLWSKDNDHFRRLSQRLGQLAEKDDWRVSTGFAGTPWILHALAQTDNLHHAYRMLQSRDCPSWLSSVLLGATTIWERWDSMLADGSINPGSMTSFNHYALGSVGSFLHSVVGGLSPAKPGWKEVLVKPQPGGTITSAKTSFHSASGWVRCEWHITPAGDKLKVKIEIPPNCTAKIVLPGLEESVGSGKREYEVAWKKDERFPPALPVASPYGPAPSTNWEP